MIKLLTLSVLASVVANVIGDTATLIGALAAGLAGAGYITTQIVRFLRDATKLTRRVLQTYQILEALPPWMEAVNMHLARLDKGQEALGQKADAIHEPVEAVARELDISHRQKPAA